MYPSLVICGRSLSSFLSRDAALLLSSLAYHRRTGDELRVVLTDARTSGLRLG